MDGSMKFTWMLHLATLAFFLGLMIISPIISPFSIALGASPLIVGLLSSLSSMVAIIGRPLSGLLSDRGRKFETLMLGGVLGCSAAFVYVSSNNLWLFALGRILHGFASASFMPASISTAIDLSPIGRVGETLGWRSTMFGISQLFGPGLGGYLAELYGFIPTFLVALFLSFISLVIVYLTRRSVPKSLVTHVSEKRNVIQDFKKLLRPNFLGAMAAVSFHAIGTSAIFTFLPAFYGSVGLGTGAYGLFASVQGGSSILTRATSGKFADRRGPIPIASLGAILMTIAYILLNFFSLPPLSLISASIFGIGMGLWVPSIQLFALGKLDPEVRGFGSGIYSMAFDFGFLVGPIFFGYLIEVTSGYLYMFLSLPFFTVGALLVIQVVSFLIRRRG